MKRAKDNKSSCEPSDEVGLEPDELNIPWLESPFAELFLARQDELDPLEREYCRRYMEDGYVVLPSGIPNETLDAIVEGLEGSFRPGSSGVYSNEIRVQDAWRTSSPPTREAILTVADAPNIIDLLRVLYRREPVPFQTLNFRVGTQQGTHSDTIHFNSIPERFMCGVWIALEDIHPDSGPLHYYPGSHRLPVFDLHDLAVTASLRSNEDGSPEIYGEGYDRYERFIAALAKATNQTRETFCVKKGEALIWSANLLHGGDPRNNPELSRHSMVTHYYFEDCLYYTPLQSDPFLKRIQYRNIQDIRTGRIHQNHYNSTPLPPEVVTLPSPPHQVPTTYGGTKDPLVLAPAEPSTVSEAPASGPAQGQPACILTWPLWEDQEQLRHLAADVLAPVVGQQEFLLCLRHSKHLDPPLAQAIEQLERVFREELGPDLNLDVQILSDVEEDLNWRAVSKLVTCVIVLDKGGRFRNRFLSELRLPQCSDGDELRALIDQAA